MKPILHAASAAFYIASVVWVLDFATSGSGEGELGLLAPVLGLSLLVLSVCVMAYLFFYKPVTLYIEGSKQGAVTFFFTTVLSFAAFVAVIFGVAATL